MHSPVSRRGFFSALATAAAAPAVSPLARARQAAKSFNLKIAGLKTFNVAGAGLFVKVLTNQGLTGLGEGTMRSKENAVAAAVMELERYLVGKDPTDIEILFQGMYRVPRWRGGPILNTAISAVEIALWDIWGKALGVPIYKLMGGAARRRLRLYRDVSSTPEAILQAKSEGFTAIKTGFLTVRDEEVNPTFSVRDVIPRFRDVRKAAGDDIDIGVDAHGQLTTVMAIDFCTGVEELHPLFIEEPTQIEDLDELALLRQKTKVPLATGERLFTKFGFAEICSRHLVNYVQPDVLHAGGILELKKIGAMAEAHRIEMAPHNPQGMVSTLASMHVEATTPAATLLEYSRHPEWETELFNGVTLPIKEGFADLPSAPGLGCDLNEKVAAAHPFKPYNRPNYHFRDGGIADY